MTRRRELGENKEERLSQKLQKKLFEQQRAVILLAAHGQTIDETATTLTISPNTVRGHRRRAFFKLDVDTIEGAIMVALRRREIFPEEVLQERYEQVRKKLDTLSPNEQKVLDVLTEEGRTKTSNAQLTTDSLLKPHTISGHMGNIISKLDASGREQVVAIAVSAQIIEEQACLTSLSSAVDQEELTEMLDRKFYKESFARLRKRYSTIGIFETIFAGIKNDLLDSNNIIGKFDVKKLSRLEAKDLTLLERFIKDDGRQSSYTTIAKESGITTNAVARHFSQIRHLLEIDIHPGILYYALDQKRNRKLV